MDNKNKTILIHTGLFLLTLCTTTIAGAEWMTGKSLFYGDVTLSLTEVYNGLHYSIPFLLILTVHEFGHYFMAQYHKVKVTLPFYIPLWFGFIPGAPSLGTMGALIKIKELIDSRQKYFDIGVAGPLAGFVIALIVLIYGFTNLPTPESVFEIHPDYEQYGLDYADKVYTYEYNVQRHFEVYSLHKSQDSIAYLKENQTIDDWSYDEFQELSSYDYYDIGNNLLFELFAYLFASEANPMPNSFELMHYPYLFAGFLALLFTSINLLPIGQLDGGHILYGLLGNKRHRLVARTCFLALVFYSGLGIIDPFHLSTTMRDELLYLGFLYLCFYKFSPKVKNRIMYVIGIIVGQMATTLLFPSMEGYSGWLMFSFLIGRVLGVDHPHAQNNAPLDFKRKVIGWVSIGVFILSFSPQPFKLIEIKKEQPKAELSQPMTSAVTGVIKKDLP